MSHLADLGVSAMLRSRTALDEQFYDVGVITDAEKACLAKITEGSLIVVQPSGVCSTLSLRDEARLPGIACCPARLEKNVQQRSAFLARWKSVRILSVAGVGSSALGGAALARNVADSFGEPVLAVVAGNGTDDLEAEALSGAFTFGPLNSLRELQDTWGTVYGGASLFPFWSSAWQASESVTEASARLAPPQRQQFLHSVFHEADLGVLVNLLQRRQPQFSLLVGHSKGNLIVSEALHDIGDATKPPALKDGAWIITLSATVEMPLAAGRVLNVMGSMDPLGAANSRFGLPVHEWIPFAGHSTNTSHLNALRVTQILRDVQKRYGVVL